MDQQATNFHLKKSFFTSDHCVLWHCGNFCLRPEIIVIFPSLILCIGHEPGTPTTQKKKKKRESTSKKKGRLFWLINSFWDANFFFLKAIHDLQGCFEIPTRYSAHDFLARLHQIWQIREQNGAVSYLFEIYDHSRVSPFDDQIGVDFHCEIPIVNLEDLKVVKANGHIQRFDALFFRGIDWGYISERGTKTCHLKTAFQIGLLFHVFHFFHFLFFSRSLFLFASSYAKKHASLDTVYFKLRARHC